jgi:hypothetical protein
MTVRHLDDKINGGGRCLTPETLIMRSPFPGMDPYLERFWDDVHATMISRARAAIQKHLPADLVARVEERVYLENSEEKLRSFTPDVRIVERREPREPHLRTSNGLAVAEPLIVQIPEIDEVRQGFIQIIDLKSGRKVVTVIEVLSPSNKRPGVGRELYLKKQQELWDAGASLVEIDLVRAGNRVMSAPFELIPDGHRTPYAICVRRACKPRAFEYYRVPLRERLPAIAIPLREADQDLPLDLQAVLDECGEEGRYVEDIDYQLEPDPPLTADDASWADALLREQKLR